MRISSRKKGCLFALQQNTCYKEDSFSPEVAMEAKEIRKIINEELARQHDARGGPAILIGLCVAEARRRIMLTIAEKTMKSGVSEKQRDIFLAAIDTERDVKLFRLLLLSFRESDDTNCDVTIDDVSGLLSIYERCRNMCEFLNAEFENAPQCPRNHWGAKGKERLLSLAAEFEKTRSALRADVMKHKRSEFDPEHIEAFEEVIDWTRVVAVGRERYQEFTGTLKGALQVLMLHVEFISLNGSENLPN